jgi:hypothetical protein
MKGAEETPRPFLSAVVSLDSIGLPIVMRGFYRASVFLKKMDCRVEHGNDGPS